MNVTTARTRTATIVAVMGVIMTLVTASPSHAQQPAQRTANEQTIERKLFDLHNQARQNPATFGYNQTPQTKLRWAPDLANVARNWSDTMAAASDFRHNPNYANETCCWQTIGENIARGGDGYVTFHGPAATADQFIQMWMDSDGHRRNIMNGRFTQVGIGTSITSSGAVYITALFRLPTSDAPPSYPHYTSPTSTPDPGRCDSPYALVGDWDGSGKDQIGWWCDGTVRLRKADGGQITYQYGRAGDVPIVADWNGNGQDTVSIIRDGTWHVNNRLSGGAAQRTFHYGRVTQGDVPIAGDWTGNGRDLPAIVRDREWHLRSSQSSGNATWKFIYGRLTRGDLPLWGDWNGDGRDTVGIVRDGRWHLRNSHAGGPSDINYIYGRVLAGDIPVVGDWNGNGIDTPAIVRDGRWHLRYQHAGGAADAVIAFAAPN